MYARITPAGLRCAVATVALLLSQAAAADLVDIVNDIRAAGCGRRAPAKEQVRADSALDAAALDSLHVALTACLEGDTDARRTR